MAYELTIPCVDFVKKIIFVFKAYSDLVNWLEPQGGGGNSHMKQTGMLVGNFEFNP